MSPAAVERSDRTGVRTRKQAGDEIRLELKDLSQYRHRAHKENNFRQTPFFKFLSITYSTLYFTLANLILL